MEYQEESVIFYGSTRQGEAIMILVRFVDNDWNICAKSMNGDQLAQVLNEYLSLKYGVRGDSLIAAIRDGPV